MGFNFFLEFAKDDKERTHSEFLRFIIREKPLEMSEFLGVELSADFSVFTEFKAEGKSRIDLAIMTDSGRIFIENKFKAAPDKLQLEGYEKSLNAKYSGGNEFILFSFAKPAFDSGAWKCFTYKQYLAKLETLTLEGDKQTALNHYREMLAHYVKKHEWYVMEPETVFEKHFENEHDPWFWRMLVLGELKNAVEFKYPEILRSDSGFGRADVYDPVLDLVPAGWAEGFYIQIQSGEIKLYYSYDGGKIPDSAERIINKAAKMALTEPGIMDKCLNKSGKGKKSFYVFKEKLINQGVSSGGVASLAERVGQFYEKCNAIAKN